MFVFRLVMSASGSEDEYIQKNKHMMISSFGRTQDKFGRRSFRSVGHDGYRRVIHLATNCNIRVNVAVHYLFNDPELLHWKPGDTIDHIDPGFEFKCQDHHWRLRRASRSEQVLNRVTTDEKKQSNVVKQCIGRVQAREWRGCKVGNFGRARTPIGGVPDPWDDSSWWYGFAEAARNTGFSNSAKLSQWVNDGKPHRCQTTGILWEFRLLKPLDESEESERWARPGATSICKTWWPSELWVSDLGRYKWGQNGIPCFPSKSGVYRTICIAKFNWKYHEVVGWLLFGTRPSEQHTIDHDDKTLDSDGCLSNRWSNLLGWADRKQQILTRGTVNKRLDVEKPCSLKRIMTGEVLSFKSVSEASVYANVSQSSIKDWITGRYKSDVFTAWYRENNDIVHVRVHFECGKLTIKTEVEKWKELKKEDWDIGGKYNKVQFGAFKRKTISESVTSHSNDPKRKRAGTITRQ